MHRLNGMGALSDLLTEHGPFECSDRSVHVCMEPHLRYRIAYCIEISKSLYSKSLYLQVVVCAYVQQNYEYMRADGAHVNITAIEAMSRYTP